VTQTGYLLAAFACVAVVIVAWLALILAKVQRVRRDAAGLEDELRESADG
jgi:hypothetical protein